MTVRCLFGFVAVTALAGCLAEGSGSGTGSVGQDNDGSGSGSTYQPDIDTALLSLSPTGGAHRYVIPVSFHVICKDATTCATHNGVAFTPAFLGRMVAWLSADYAPPADGFFGASFAGVDFTFAHLDTVIAPTLYDWSIDNGANETAIVAGLVAGGNPYIDGYLNVMIAGANLSGVAGINQRLDGAAVVNVGGSYLQDDASIAGLFGSSTLAHEIGHLLGLVHVADGGGERSAAIQDPACGTAFTTTTWADTTYLGFDGTTCHPERNNIMSYGRTSFKGPTAQQCGRASMFTADSSAPDGSLGSRFEADGVSHLPSRYDAVTETTIACWADQNFVLAAPPLPVTSAPAIAFSGVAAGAAITAPTPFTIAVGDSVDPTTTVVAASWGVDSPDGSGVPLSSALGATLDPSGLPNGYHELAVQVANSAGAVTYNAQPFYVLNPPAAGCVRVEACVDGSDSVALASGALAITHRSGALTGTHSDCRYIASLIDGQPLFASGGGWTVAGTRHPLGSVAVGLGSLSLVEVIDGRGSAVLDAATQTVTLTDPAGGASRYVVDVCGS